MLLAAQGAAAQALPDIQQRLAQLKVPGTDTIAKKSLPTVSFLEKFYLARQYQPVWNNPENVAALKRSITASWTDGLIPEDFHASIIGTPAADALSDVDREILHSDALIRLLYQLYYGKVSPNALDPNWNFKRPLLASDAAEIISTALADNKLDELIDRARISHPFYKGLKGTLQAYTDYAVRGGWTAVPDGPPLKPGQSDSRVPLLRARLAITGEYDPQGDQSSPIFDEHLVEAVKKFQRGHGLEDQGHIGPQTLQQLNMSAEQRIDQIRVNLERARWVLREAINEPDMVIVNIPGFYLAIIFKGERVWKTDVIVGRNYTKTPIFTASMKYVVLNPDWTQPRSIVRGETLKKAKADPSYLAANNYDIVGASGARVAPESIDWSSVEAASFPYSIVQRPGPKNALGLVKFMFPNPHNVYLHDTPSRTLFSKTGRAFSHGCVRVKDPLKMAEIILGDRGTWSRAQIDGVIASGKTQQVNLSKPIPVLILYWTVDPTFDGGARFYDDIYGRDAVLLKALNAPFRPVQQ